MLQAQVNYWNLIEQRRHNIRTEDIDAFNSETQRMAFHETARHNVETEKLGFNTLAESQRHNLVTEEQGFQNIELSKQNLQLQRDSLAETIRTHQANEAIGWANVSIGQAQTSVAQANANTNRLQAYIQEQNVANQYAINKYNAKTDRINARTNEQNANARAIEAKTKVQDSTTRRMEYNLREADTKVGWFQSIFDSAGGLLTRR